MISKCYYYDLFLYCVDVIRPAELYLILGPSVLRLQLSSAQVSLDSIGWYPPWCDVTPVDNGSQRIPPGSQGIPWYILFTYIYIYSAKLLSNSVKYDTTIHPVTGNRYPWRGLLRVNGVSYMDNEYWAWSLQNTHKWVSLRCSGFTKQYSDNWPAVGWFLLLRICFWVEHVKLINCNRRLYSEVVYCTCGAYKSVCSTLKGFAR